MPLHDSTFLLPGEFMKDLSQARVNLAIESLAPILGDEDHMILAFPTRVRQALPRCVCHTALLRICQQAILGGLYSRNAQSCSSHTSRTSGLPPGLIYLRSPMVGSGYESVTFFLSEPDLPSRAQLIQAKELWFLE